MKKILCFIFIIVLVFPVCFGAMGDYDGNITGAAWYWPIHGYTSTSAAYSMITSSYGYRGGAFNGYHRGVDIGAGVGTSVYPTRGGTVSEIHNSTSGSYGRYVVINHNDGYFSIYMHLSRIDVSEEGQSVDVNTQIGTVGASGYGYEKYPDYGYHLHMGIHYGSSFSFDCSVNPCPNGYTRIGNSLQASAGGYPIGSASISYSVNSAIEEPTTPTAPTFRGCVDSCSGGEGTVSLSGWAYYTKDASKSIEVHTYIGGNHTDPNAEGHVLYANVHRPDVNSVYGCGDYHGFEGTLKTKKSGNQNVYVYAVNGDEHLLLETYSVTISADCTAPIIEKIWFTDLSENSFTINLRASDNTNVQQIGFLPWGDETDSSDNTWHPISTNGKTAEASQIVKISAHNNETGTYYAEVSAYDDNWNATKIRMDYGVFIDEYKDLGKNFYAYIVNTKFNRAVTSDAQGNVYSTTFNKNDNQLWYFEKMDDKSYVVSSFKTGLALDVVGGSNDLGAKLMAHTKHNGDNQRWYIQGEKNEYRLRAKSGWCVLDLYGCDTSEGAEFWMFGSNNSDAQMYGIINTDAIKVTFNANGGTTPTVSKSVSYASTYGTLPTPSRTGYKFKGWYTAKSGGTQITSSTRVTITVNQTLYAQWSTNGYQVRFHGNGGTVDVENKKVQYDQNYGELPNPTRLGYNFKGWNSRADGNGTQIKEATIFSHQDGVIFQDLYAQWDACTYKVSFHGNGGETQIESKTVSYETTYGELPIATRNGYTFLGWYTEENDEEQITNSTKVSITSDTTLYAQWRANTYNVSYNPNGGAGESITSSHTYNTESVLAENRFTRDGYKFAGWSTDKSATTAMYSDKQSVNNLSEIDGDTVTLYAIWVEDEAEEPIPTQYSFAQSVQIGLIEPWFLKANARVYTSDKPTNIDYNALVDYGAYFIRASKLSDINATQETLSVEDIINDSDTVKYSKKAGTAGVDGSYITANYDKGLYTYEMSDSIFVLFYIEDENGITYAPIRERNLKELLGNRKDDEVNFKNKLERDVYTSMDKLELDIGIYRAQFDEIDELGVQDAPTLASYVKANGSFEEETVKSYSFGNSVQLILVEPWGLKVNARVYNSENPTNINYNTVEEYGAIVFYDTEKTIEGGVMSSQDLRTKADAYVFSSKNGDATIDGSYITALYNKEIYTHLLDRNAYVMFYIKDENGYHYSDVKVRNAYELAKTRNVDNSGNFGEKEKVVYGDMVTMYDSVKAYRDDYFGNK